MNLATREWIILAAERQRRPTDFLHERPPRPPLPAHDPHCPFCPGQEEQTPPTLAADPPTDTGMAWRVRAVPNKFAALAPSPVGLAQTTSLGPYLRRDGVGHHEVIIESPRHNQDLPMLPAEHMAAVIWMHHQRYLALAHDPAVEMVLVFRNHGEQAGTSLIHPHSQIVASSVVPSLLRDKLYQGQQYYDLYGRCVYCDIVAQEESLGERMIVQNEHFVAIAPYASSVPYEIWLVPRRHRACFGMAEADELVDLAAVLQHLLARLWRLLDDPDYNYIIDTAPERMGAVPFYHWHLEIYPRLTTRAGFEIGTGIGINAQPPEQAAASLRETDGSRIDVKE